MLGGQAAGGREQAFIDPGVACGVGVVEGPLGGDRGGQRKSVREGDSPPRNEKREVELPRPGGDLCNKSISGWDFNERLGGVPWGRLEWFPWDPFR